MRLIPIILLLAGAACAVFGSFTALCLTSQTLHAEDAKPPKDEKLDPAVAEKVYRTIARAQLADQQASLAMKEVEAAHAEAVAACAAKKAALVEQPDGFHCIAKPDSPKEPAK